MARKILKNTPKTKKYLEELPKIYVLFLWAKWAVVELPWSGKYKDGMPLVYHYFDCNGTCDEYRLIPVHQVSSGHMWNWFYNKEQAEQVRAGLNKNPDFEEVAE